MIKFMTLLSTAALVGLSLQARADFDLGSAGNFAVLAGSTVTNTGSSVINGGNVGVNPGSAITGFLPGTVAAPYSILAADPLTAQAQVDLAIAYNAAAAMTPTQNLTGVDLGGLVLTPGTYFFALSAQLTGSLTLNDLGDPNARFVFQIGSTLMTASGSTVAMIPGGASTGRNVFWQVGSSATLGSFSHIEGHILANTDITVTTGVTITDGSVLAMHGAVILDSDNITNSASAAVPEPASLILSALGGFCLALPNLAKKIRHRRAVKQDSSV